jgi:hypothetical protein
MVGKGTRARISALQNRNPYAGIISATPAKRSMALMIPRLISSDDKEQILGTKSNNALTPEARVMDPAALQSFVGIAPKTKFPEGSQIHNTPLDLEHNDIKLFYPLTDNKSAAELYGELYVGRVTCSIPIPSGLEEVLTGRLEDQTVESWIHETYGEYGDNWLQLVLNYKQDIVDAIMNSPTLKANYVPATRNRNHLNGHPPSTDKTPQIPTMTTSWRPNRSSKLTVQKSLGGVWTPQEVSRSLSVMTPQQPTKSMSAWIPRTPQRRRPDGQLKGRSSAQAYVSSSLFLTRTTSPNHPL